MKLYDFPFSPNSRKVRAVAYELGIALDTQRVDLLTGGQRSPEFLARNPNGRVPVLEDGDLIPWESAAIIRYLAAGSSLRAIDAVEIRDGKILRMHPFMQPAVIALFLQRV